MLASARYHTKILQTLLDLLRFLRHARDLDAT